MPILFNYTKFDKKGRLRSMVEFSCQKCNSISDTRAEEYRRRNGLCLKCKWQENSDKLQLNRDVEVVCSNIILNRLNGRYSKKGLFCNLNSDDLLNILKSNCHYCGSKPSNIYNYVQKFFKYEFAYNGVDRINSKLGYIYGNVLPCCKKCNLAKSDMEYNEFIEHIKLIYKNINNANI